MDGGVSYSIWNYGGEVCFVALSPINVGSTQLGVLGLGYPIANQVRELSRATGLDVTVLHDERVVACSWDEARRSTAADGPPSSFSSIDWSQVLPGVNSRLRVRDRELMATSVVLAPSAYRLVLTRPLDHLMMPFQHARTELVLVGILIASVALLVSRWVAGRIASPIRSLTEAAGALARGDLTAHVAIASTDEVGTLGRTFNSMARQLEGAMHDVVKKARAAEEANEAKSAFLATISHELRTPLNAILGFNEQLQATSLSGEQRDFLQTAQRSGEDLLRLIDKLLDFARMESGDFRIDHIEFDLHDCILRTVETMSAAIRGKGLVLDVSIDAALPRTVLGPGRPVRQVLSHYLSNAAKFTASGTVRVHASMSSEDPKSNASEGNDDRKGAERQAERRRRHDHPAVEESSVLFHPVPQFLTQSDTDQFAKEAGPERKKCRPRLVIMGAARASLRPTNTRCRASFRSHRRSSACPGWSSGHPGV